MYAVPVGVCNHLTLQELESFHLHRVVELSAGIKDDYVASNAAGAATDANKHHKVNPVEKLKEALSSKDAFQKYYLVGTKSLRYRDGDITTI